MTTVLIVEDDDAIRNNVARLLRLEGYEVSVAVNGTEGLEQARALRPDVVVSDINMPGIDGFALVQAVRADPVGRATQAGPEIRLALAYQAMADVLPPLMRRGAVPVRVAHNDAKIANVLFEAGSGRALAVVDLDTVMPGSALHDFGDLVRSSVSASAEDETDLSRVDVRIPWFRALVEGYLSEAGSVLTPDERRLLVFAGRLITLEQAVRFLTDHLQGDRYYRTTRAGQNLDRARTQFRLFERLTERMEELEEIVAGR